MLSLIPMVTAWLAFGALCRELVARRCLNADWRWSWIMACAGWGVCATLIVEVSSSLRCLNAPMLLACWCLANAWLWGMAVALVRQRKGRLTEWISPVTGMGGRFKAFPWD